jgi:hypothetical protein
MSSFKNHLSGFAAQLLYLLVEPEVQTEWILDSTLTVTRLTHGRTGTGAWLGEFLLIIPASQNWGSQDTRFFSNLTSFLLFPIIKTIHNQHKNDKNISEGKISSPSMICTTVLTSQVIDESPRCPLPPQGRLSWAPYTLTQALASSMWSYFLLGIVELHVLRLLASA